MNKNSRYSNRTKTPQNQEWQRQVKQEHNKKMYSEARSTLNEILQTVAPYCTYLTDVKELQEAVLLYDQSATTTVLRHLTWALLREAGYTIPVIAIAVNRSPSTVTHGISRFYEKLIDNSISYIYTDKNAEQHCKLPKEELLVLYRLTRKTLEKEHEPNPETQVS